MMLECMYVCLWRICGDINETRNIQFTWTEKDWETRRVWLIETVSRTMIRHS